MKTFFHTLRCDLKRAICSKRFAAASTGLAIVTLFGLWVESKAIRPGETTIVHIRMVLQYWQFDIVYLLFAAIPGATVFCADWENRFIRFSMPRSSKKIYGISKAISCFLSAVSVVGVSEWLIIGILSPFFPVCSLEDQMYAYSEFTAPEAFFLRFGIEILFKAFCAGCFAIFALWFSTKLTNTLVTLAMPVLVYYFVNTFVNALRLPGFLSVSMLSKGRIYIGDSEVLTGLYIIGFFLLIAAVFAVLFVKSCKRRVENG